MEKESEWKRPGRSAATYAVIAFVLLYLLSPPIFLLPVYAWYGSASASKLPPHVRKITRIYAYPGDYLMGRIPAYGRYVQWQWKTFYMPIFM